MTPSSVLTSMTAVARSRCCAAITARKSNRAFPHGAVGVPPPVVVVEVHVLKPRIEEPREAVVEVRMAGIEGEPAPVNQPEVLRRSGG